MWIEYRGWPKDVVQRSSKEAGLEDWEQSNVDSTVRGHCRNGYCGGYQGRHERATNLAGS